MIDTAGLFSLSILNTLNLERNIMEHDYRIPSPARVQEVIDVGRLLLLATQRLGEYVAYECLTGWRADQALGVVQLDPARGVLSFFKWPCIADGQPPPGFPGMELPDGALEPLPLGSAADRPGTRH